MHHVLCESCVFNTSRHPFWEGNTKQLRNLVLYLFPKVSVGVLNSRLLENLVKTENCENAKGVIKSHKSRTDYTMVKRKRTNNDLQNTIQKTKD